MAVQQGDIYAYTPNGTPIRRRRSAGVVAPTTSATPPVSTRPAIDETSDKFYSTRPATSVTRYARPGVPVTQPQHVQAHPQQRIALQPKQAAPAAAGAPARKRGFHVHWMCYVGLGMLAMLGMWLALGALLNWYNTWQDDLTYGIPRTFQTNAVVGHGDSQAHPTHFIVLNLLDQDGQPQIEIIEIPGGNGSKAKIYPGPEIYGPGADLTPITLSFQNTGDAHHPEMIVHFQGSNIIYLNQRVNGTWQFVPQH